MSLEVFDTFYLFSILNVWTMIYHGELIVWFCLFGLLCASCILMGTFFLSLEKFSFFFFFFPELRTEPRASHSLGKHSTKHPTPRSFLLWLCWRFGLTLAWNFSPSFMPVIWSFFFFYDIPHFLYVFFLWFNFFQFFVYLVWIIYFIFKSW